MSSGVPGLFKFGKNVHIEEFCTLGRLYMKSLCDFRRIEADALRSDRKEGTHWTFPSDQVKLQMEINGVFQDIPEISGPIRYSRDRDQSINVFCMYALRRKDPQTLIDPKNFGFGDTYVLLKDGDEFLRRVRNSPVPQGQQLSWQLVEYVASATFRAIWVPSENSIHSNIKVNFVLRWFRGEGKPSASTLVTSLISQRSGSSLR